MIIVIDAYNFIKHIAGIAYVSDREVRYWIERFKEYARLRSNAVMLFFDAGPGLYQIVEYYGKVTVVYSGQMQTADDVIKDWLKDRDGHDVLLVTSDREIRTFADTKNIASVGSDDFYKIFNHIMDQEEQYEHQVVQTAHKMTTEEVPGLDELMEQGSRFLVSDDTQRSAEMPLRVRNGKKTSKMDKRLLRKIEKI